MIRAPLAMAAALALLAGCERQPAGPGPQATASAPQPSPDAPAPGLAIEAAGLRLLNQGNGQVTALPFGSDWATVGSALVFRGAGETGRNEECGAGPLDFASWPDGLTLYAQDGKFAGWALDRRASGVLLTASGVGPGSTREQLDSALPSVRVFPSSLGTEFEAGELFGVLEGTAATAKIIAMWSGVSCNFR